MRQYFSDILLKAANKLSPISTKKGTEQPPAILQTSAKDAPGGIVLDPERNQIAYQMKGSRLPIQRRQYGTSPYTAKKASARYGKFEGIGGISYPVLRLTVERSPLLQAIHSVRQFQTKRLAAFVKNLNRDVGARIIHQNQYEENFEITDEIKKRCKEVQRLFECPHPIYEQSFQGLEIKFTEEHLSINRPVIELIRNRKGQVIQFGMLDGAALEPTYIKVRAMIQGNTTEFQQLNESAKDRIAREKLSEKEQLDYFADYIYYVDGIAQASFYDRDLLICEDHRPVDLQRYGFPTSCAERAIQANLSFIKSFTYNSKYFTDGQMVDVILGLSGEFEDDTFYVVADQLRQFRGLEGAHEIPFIPLPSGSELKVTDLKKSNRDMQFYEFMQLTSALGCAKYRMHPSEINVKSMEGRSGGIFEASKDLEIDVAKDEGLYSILMLKAEFYTKIIRTIYDDLEFEYYGIQKQSRKEVVELNTKEADAYKSPNQVRIQEGLEEMDIEYFTKRGMLPARAKMMSDLMNLPNNANIVGAYMQTTAEFPDPEDQPEDDQGMEGDDQQPGQVPPPGPGGKQPPAGVDEGGDDDQPPTPTGDVKPEKKTSAERYIDSINQSIFGRTLGKAVNYGFVPIEEFLKNIEE